MFRKKFVSFLLVSLMLFLTACGSDATTGNNVSENKEQEAKTSEAVEKTETVEKKDVLIEFWNDKMGFNPEEDAILAKAWEKVSGYKIEINGFNDTASYQTAMSQSIDTDASPDLMTWWSGEQLTNLAKSDKIVPLDDLWEEIIAMGVSGDIKDAFMYEGKSYAVPYSLLNNVVIYNKNVFAEAGIENPPTSWDEFIKYCDKVKAIGKYPIGLKNDSWASFIWFQAIVAAYDPELYIGVCNGSIAYNSPEMMEVMYIWADMIEKDYFANPVNNGDNVKRFALNEIAMVIEPQDLVTSLYRDYGTVSGEDVSAFVMPSRNPEDKNIIFFEAAPMSITAKSNTIEDSKKVLKEYFSIPVQEIRATNGIILNSNVVSDDPTLAIINEYAADETKNRSILRYYENTNPEIRDFAVNEWAKFMDGNQDAQTTADNVEAKAKEIFAN